MTNETNHFGLWQPWQPEEVARFFSTLTVPWWIAGGWALDLFLGVQTRAHEDIDVLFLRRDQHEIRARLQGWDVQAFQNRKEVSSMQPLSSIDIGRAFAESV